MTPTLELWIKASIDIMQGNIDIFKEAGFDLDKLIRQGYALQNHLVSFVDYLEKKRKFG